MTPQAILLAAADLIEREGWVQGSMHIPGKGYCVSGAIDAVSGPSLYRTNAAGTLLIREAGGDSLTFWNDAEGRTKAEVIATLRKAAA